MADSNGRKLVVEIRNAKNLMPKDGQGTASAFVMVDFDGQRRRTRMISKDLNPEWNEKLEFIVHDPESMAADVLEINVYNDKKNGKRSNFLGKVKISGSGFAKSSSEDLIYYPLEKRSVFSQIKGEIGIKVWYEDPPAPAKEEKSPEAPATEEKGVQAKKEEENKTEAVEWKKEEKKEEEEKEEKLPENPKTEEAPSPAPVAEDAPKENSPPVVAEVADPPCSVAEKVEEHKSKELSTTTAKKPEPQIADPSRDLELRSLAALDRGNGTGHDLVDRMPFVYVRVVKAKRVNPDPDSLVFAKLVIGTHSIQTSSQANDKEWDQAFAFDKDGLNSSTLEVSVWAQKKGAEGKIEEEGCLGTISFDLQEVPKRVPPDSPLAPQWYSLEGSEGNDVMVAVWLGTQADEAFQEAWQSDSGGLIPETRAKVYLSPKLWYLRLTVIQTQDLQLGPATESKGRVPELFIKAQLGTQIFKTSRLAAGSTNAATLNPTWNEDLIFVAVEPFEPFLVVTVEDAANGRSVGRAKVHVASIERRSDDRAQPKSKWLNLVGEDVSKEPYAGRIHVRTCLDGGYHVLDEAAHVTSDVQPSAKQLAKAPIGLLEVGIRGANNLLPVKTKDGTRGTMDAYVVAKYGPKWVRTRTILDRFNPRWHEQYTWDVHDPCTVLTVGVFDNGRYKKDDLGKPGKDIRIGKLRIRLSTLDTNRIYLSTYPLTVVLPGGARRMGEIEIAVRFICSSWISLLQAYSSPTLPRMHYVCPLGRAQQDILRHTAMRIVTTRLARSEPALGQEVVQFMLDSDTDIWSMRKSKVNWFRVVGGLSKLAAVANWAESIRTWAHPPTTVLVHIILFAIVLCPHLVLPTFFMYAFLILALRIRYRTRTPLSVDPRISRIDVVTNDELDEEFDGFPTTRSADVVRIRYDRLRALAGRAQSFLGDMAAQWERVEALCNWRDPRATGIFLAFLLTASLVFYTVPFKAIILGSGLYYLRHPRFRDDMPSVPANFFRRLPSLSDQIL